MPMAIIVLYRITQPLGESRGKGRKGCLARLAFSGKSSSLIMKHLIFKYVLTYGKSVKWPGASPHPRTLQNGQLSNQIQV